MLIYDESGNIITNPDLQNGTLVTMVRVKADATPIDNETKFAWDESDYEEYAIYKPHMSPENIDRKIATYMRELDETDYVPCKTVDMLASCKNVDEMLTTFSQISTEYGETLARRKELRDKINALQAKLLSVQ